MKKSPLNSARLSNRYVKRKTTKIFAFCYGNIQSFFQLPMQIIASMRYFTFTVKSVKAMEANSGSDEAMKR
jgi:hypothetical protein